MKRFDANISFNTGWVEVVIDDDFIEECESMGIDRYDDDGILKRYIEDHPEEFISYLSFDDCDYEKTEDDGEFEDEEEEYE